MVEAQDDYIKVVQEHVTAAEQSCNDAVNTVSRQLAIERNELQAEQYRHAQVKGELQKALRRLSETEQRMVVAADKTKRKEKEFVAGLHHLKCQMLAKEWQLRGEKERHEHQVGQKVATAIALRDVALEQACGVQVEEKCGLEHLPLPLISIQELLEAWLQRSPSPPTRIRDLSIRTTSPLLYKAPFIEDI